MIRAPLRAAHFPTTARGDLHRRDAALPAGDALIGRRGLILAGLAGLLAGCGGGGGGGALGGPRSGTGVLEVARANGSSTFLQAVERAGLTEQLSGNGPFTLFVPTNAAFQALPSARRSAILGGEAEARRVVAYHVVPGMVTSSFMDGLDMNHMTSTGAALNVDGTGGGIRVAGASLTRSDLEARNGVVHLIDRVLLPAG